MHRTWGFLFCDMDSSQVQNTNLGSAEVKLPAREGDFAFHLASEYFDRGWGVIPLSGKRPALSSWLRFQTERASLNELREWFRGESQANIGIVTGKLSGLVVVDCDTPEDAQYWREQFPETPLSVRTGGGGAHFYYRYPAGEEIGNRVGLLSRRIDLRGEGGYVVAPSSKHPNGTFYEWLSVSEVTRELPYFSTDWILEKQTEGDIRTSSRSVKSPKNYIRSIRAVSGEGGHNQTFRAACILRDAGLTPEEALCELMVWNESNAVPPWSPHELLHKVQSAFKAQGF